MPSSRTISVSERVGVRCATVGEARELGMAEPGPVLVVESVHTDTATGRVILFDTAVRPVGEEVEYKFECDEER